MAAPQDETRKNVAGQMKLVAPDSVRSFCERSLTRAGADSRHAASLSELLVAADTRGHFSHGLNRLGTDACRSVDNPVVRPGANKAMRSSPLGAQFSEALSSARLLIRTMSPCTSCCTYMCVLCTA